MSERLTELSKASALWLYSGKGIPLEHALPPSGKITPPNFGLGPLGLHFGFPTWDDADQLRSELESLIAGIGRRVVILIDDIDRLQAEDILAVFKLARLATKLKNTVFLLSFDPVVVSSILKERSKVDPEFLEKVVQKPVSLPPAEQRDIDRFLFFSETRSPNPHISAIDRLLDETGVDANSRKKFDEKAVYFYQTHLRRLFRTIRQAKRYLNGLRATLAPALKEVDLYDFFLLEVIRVFFPALYQDIWRNPWFYIPPWTLQASLVSPFGPARNEQERYDRIRVHIEALFADEPQKDLAKAILEEIFFVEVKNALNPTSRTGHDGAAGAYRAEKRLTHPECFPKYFLYRIPAGEFADHVVEDLIRQLNESSPADMEKLTTETFREYREASQFLELLNKLRIFIRLVNVDRVGPIVRSLYRSVPNLSRSGTDPWNTEYDQAEAFILRLIEERADSPEIRPLLEEVVREVPSHHFAVMVVGSCHRTQHSTYFRIYEHINMGALRALASDRLYGHYVQGGRDIFAELPDADWGHVLYQWGTNWSTGGEENQTLVRNYVMSLIDSRPAYLGRLLRRFVGPVFPSSAVSFHLNELLQIYDPVAILDRLDRYGDSAFASGEEREAADLFRQSYRQYQQASTEPG